MEKTGSPANLYLTRAPSQFLFVSVKSSVQEAASVAFGAALLTALNARALSSIKAGLVGCALNIPLAVMLKLHCDYLVAFSQETQGKQTEALSNPKIKQEIEQSWTALKPTDVEYDKSKTRTQLLWNLTEPSLCFLAVGGGLALLRRFSLMPNPILHAVQLASGFIVGAPFVIVLFYSKLHKQAQNRK